MADATLGADPEAGYEAEVNRVVQRVLIDRLMALATSSPLPQVRAITTSRLEAYGLRMAELAAGVDDDEAAHLRMLSRDIQRFLDRPMAPMAYPDILTPPPGSPIGDGGMNWLERPSFMGTGSGWVNYDLWWWE